MTEGLWRCGGMWGGQIDHRSRTTVALSPRAVGQRKSEPVGEEFHFYFVALRVCGAGPARWACDLIECMHAAQRVGPRITDADRAARRARPTAFPFESVLGPPGKWRATSGGVVRPRSRWLGRRVRAFLSPPGWIWRLHRCIHGGRIARTASFAVADILAARE